MPVFTLVKEVVSLQGVHFLVSLGVVVIFGLSNLLVLVLLIERVIVMGGVVTFLRVSSLWRDCFFTSVCPPIIVVHPSTRGGSHSQKNSFYGTRGGSLIGRMGGWLGA